MSVDVERVAAATRDLLSALGENPDREGLVDTPHRVANLWKEFLDHYPGKLSTAFRAEGTDQLVVVGGLKAWSFCEHHLLPFTVSVTVGYIAHDKILGLSKFGRIVEKYARRLQVQERLTEQIATSVAELTDSLDVAVLARGEHLCMTMRGVRKAAQMTTSVMLGKFRERPEARAEFLALARGQ
jgi:GTP cyclohydrolase I